MKTKKETRGAKKKKDTKIAVTRYIEKSIVKKHGGLEKLKDKVGNFIYAVENE